MCLEVGRIMTARIRATGVRRNRRPSVQIRLTAGLPSLTVEPARGSAEPGPEVACFQKDCATAVPLPTMVYSRAPECHQMFGLARRTPDCQLATDPCNPPLLWETSSSVATFHWGFAKNPPRQQ